MRSKRYLVKKILVWSFFVINFLTTTIVLSIEKESFSYLLLGFGGAFAIAIMAITKTIRDVAFKDFILVGQLIGLLIFSVLMSYYLMIHVSISACLFMFLLIIIETMVVLMI